MPHAVLDGKIYIPGGFRSGGAATDLVEVFQPATNSWSTIPPLPITMHHLSFAAVNGQLYVLGGYTGNSFTPTPRVFAFNFTTNNWTERASLPAARGAAVAAVHNGLIYVIGGVNSAGTVVGANEVYDPLVNKWIGGAAMPTPREHLAAAVIDSLIYVVGGRNFFAGGNSNRLEAYSPQTNRWYSLRNMPTARGGLAAAALHGRLYAFGGETPGVFAEVEEYDPAQNLWRQMTPMPSPRHGIGAATIADTIFIIGGGPTEGFGVSRVNSGFTIPAPTAVHDESHHPRQFTLHQNHPNPFNGGTVIRFELTNRSMATLKVFDVLGNVVATIINRELEAGVHHIHWDAGGLASGIYFYQMQASNQMKTRKLIVMR